MVERVSPESLRTAKFGDHTYQRRVITGPDSIEHIAAYIESLEADIASLKATNIAFNTAAQAHSAWKAEAMEALLDAAAHLAAASSAYDKFAARHKDLKPRAVADPMFTTRNSDFIKAASRASSAARRLVEKEDGRHA